MDAKEGAIVGFLAILLLGVFWTAAKDNYNAQPVEYSDISHLQNINGSLGYLAVKEGNVKGSISPFKDVEIKAVVDGREINMGKERMAKTFDVNFPLGPSSQPTKPYLATKENKTVIVSEFGNITPEYTPLTEMHVLRVEDSIAYATSQNGGFFYVVNGTPRERFQNILPAKVVNGKLAYVAADTPNENNTFVLFDGERIGDEYDSVTKIAEIDGKLAYVAYENHTGFVVHDGKKYGKFLGEKLGEKDFRITHLEGIKGKPFFTGETGKHFFYYHGDKSIGSFKTAALNPLVKDNQIIFDAEIDGEENIVRWKIN